MGLNFGMSQGKVSTWIKVLLPILQENLAKFGDLLSSDGTTLDVILKESNQEKFHLEVLFVQFNEVLIMNYKRYTIRVNNVLM